MSDRTRCFHCVIKGSRVRNSFFFNVKLGWSVQDLKEAVKNHFSPKYDGISLADMKIYSCTIGLSKEALEAYQPSEDEELSDYLLLTSDCPRSSDGQHIEFFVTFGRIPFRARTST